MSEFTLKNPCKYCLSRPICDNICDDFAKHNNIFSDVLTWICIASIGLLIILTCIILYTFTISPYREWIGTGIIIFAYMNVIKEMFGEKTRSGWKGLDWWEHIIVWVLGPMLLSIGFVWHMLSIDRKIETFMYRYIKDLQ